MLVWDSGLRFTCLRGSDIMCLLVGLAGIVDLGMRI